eukprot:CAMPEP_0184747374 /NCGR_PEP_ID=MMETSP0315-20130426/10510_1 /TAXON_ID=101924 /ORGANISM="Rhodosorus marinus, Strain UTEX LB 2760" /LENGTH=206 /DNA_ID=CAMNT_0027220411 /DNA_START=51 /DNA_END=668 /DNA_ORIENTATION=-
MAFLIPVSNGTARSTVLRTSTKPNGNEGVKGVARAAVRMSAEVGKTSFDFDKIRGRMLNLVESKLTETRANAQAWTTEQGSILSSDNAKVATMALLSAMVFSCAPVAPVLAADSVTSPTMMQQNLQVADKETSASAKTQLADNGQQKNGPQRWRYSKFIDAVEKDQVEKVTFSADGQRLLAIDVDGNRFRLDALPNDPNLLKTLTE